jgi:hypothetical protein
MPVNRIGASRGGSVRAAKKALKITVQGYATVSPGQKFQIGQFDHLRTLTKIALDERLDARIDKLVKRLAQLKAFKQVVEEQASRARIDQHSIPDHRPQTSTN